DGTRDIFIGRPGGSAPTVSRVAVDDTFTMVQRNGSISQELVSGLGSSIAVANSSADSPGDIIMTAPQRSGTPPGSVVVAPFQALIDSRLTRVSELVPADLGTVGAAPATAQFATKVVTVRDVDGDGKSDFLVGAPGIVIDGSAIAGFFVSSVSRTIVGPRVAMSASSTTMGAEVSALGDIDGDGDEDYAFGAPDDGSRGRVFLQRSTQQGLSTIEPPSAIVTANARFGFAVSPIGDVDGDGRNEILIGAPLDTLNGALDVPGCDVHSPRAYSGDCSGGVYLVPSTQLEANTAIPCFLRGNVERAGRLGHSLRALGPSLIPELTADHQRFVVGSPGLVADVPQTSADDGLGVVLIVTFTFNPDGNNGSGGCAVNAVDLGIATPGSFLGEALPH
ncbi:MAG TPA: integrin alpha, partial [Myxococcota bacterium]